MKPTENVPYPKVYRWGSAGVREVRVNGKLIHNNTWVGVQQPTLLSPGAQVAPVTLNPGSNQIRYRIRGKKGDSYGFVVAVGTTNSQAWEVGALSNDQIVLDCTVSV